MEQYVNQIFLEDYVQFLKKLPNNCIDLFLLDPPYEIDYDNDKDYNDSKGIINYSLLREECYRVLKDTGNLLLFAGWSNLYNILKCFAYKEEGTNLILENRIIWDRQKYKGQTNNLPNSAEDVLWFSKTNKRTFNKIESNIKKVTKGFGLKNGHANRILTNVWSDIPPLIFSSEEYKDGYGYKGQKPTVLLNRIIRVFSNENDIVCDCFCGSGSTAISCLRTNRQFIVSDELEKAISITKLVKESPIL